MAFFKRIAPVGLVSAFVIVSGGWAASTFGQSDSAAAAQGSPVPTVSVTTLPAMPGTTTQTEAPSTMAPAVTTPAMTNNASTWTQPIQPPLGVSYIEVVGDVNTPTTLTLKDLEGMKRASLTLRFHTYTGVPLIDVINRAGLHFSDDPQTLMRKYVYIQGVDGRSVTISFPEFTKQFNGQLILLAYLVDLRPVQGPGFVTLVVQDDNSTIRYIPVARIIVGEPLE